MNIVEAMDDPALFGDWFNGPSWNSWRAILRGAYALPMTDAEQELFAKLTGGRRPPRQQVRELWVIAGRRSGKDSAASLIGAYTAAFTDFAGKVRPGEPAIVMCLAWDRLQAKIVRRYAGAYFERIPMLRELVARETADGIELTNGAELSVHTNNFRAVRGRSLACVIMDEVAFWKDDDSAAPDRETYNAVVPGLSTIPGAMLVGISSPYRKTGLLYDKWKSHFGQDDDRVLVVQAATPDMNTTCDPEIIAQAVADDPEAARAEWYAEFRNDLSGFIDREIVEGLIVPGRRELLPHPQITYTAFCDPSGGSGTDSMTLAVAHGMDGRAILDCVREVRPPFHPQSVVYEFVQVLRAFNLTSVQGDRFGGEWVASQFRNWGINYIPSIKSKSEIYGDFLPILNSGMVELLDNDRLVAQLCSLERRTARGGRDSYDHPSGPAWHDDLVNSAAGALINASGLARRRETYFG